MKLQRASRRSHKRRLRAGVIACAVLWGSTAETAFADTISYSTAFGTQFGSGGDVDVPPFSQQVQLDSFDPSLGTLTGIQLSFSNLIFNAGVLVTGSTFAPTTVSYTGVGMSQVLTLSAADGTELTYTYTLGPLDGSVAYTSAQDFLLSPALNASNTASGGNVPNSDFSSFEGSQDITLTAAIAVPTVTGSVSFGIYGPYGLPAGGGNVVLTGGEAGGDATITYTYTPNIAATPEPQVSWLIVAGGAMLGLMVSRRRVIESWRARAMTAPRCLALRSRR